MRRLACNVCGVTTVYGSNVGSSSCCRLQTRCSLSVISPDRPSTASVLASLWILHVFCLNYHQPICVSVCVAASASLQHLTTSSFCPEALLCFYCFTVSHRLASMGVRSAATCLGENTISPTDCAMKSERGAPVRGSDSHSGHSVHKTAGDRRRAPARRLIQTRLAAAG